MIFVFLSLNLFAQTKESSGDNFTHLSTYKTEEILQYVASESTKKLPLQIDLITALVNVTTNKNTYQYIKQINTKHTSLKDVSIAIFLDSLQIRLFETDVKLACNEPLFKYLIYERKAVFEYVYETKASKPLFKYQVAIENCDRLLK